MIKKLLPFVMLVLLAATLSACNVVRVSKGDTLYSISRRKNVTVRALIERNHLVAPYTLKIGQRLIIPRTEYYRVHFSQKKHLFRFDKSRFTKGCVEWRKQKT